MIEFNARIKTVGISYRQGGPKWTITFEGNIDTELAAQLADMGGETGVSVRLESLQAELFDEEEGGGEE